MLIRNVCPDDLPSCLALWNAACADGEVVYKPLDEHGWQTLFARNPHYDPAYDFVCEENGAVIGWINGAEKKTFLPGESRENAPGYITCIHVRKDMRRLGVGTALLHTLEEAFRRNGKSVIQSSGSNPISLGWFIPGTDGHDHNNAPGTDVDCMGYRFLLKNAYADVYREVAMYLNLKNYVCRPEVEDIRARLAEEGIIAGVYDVSMGCEFDGMCDRVHSEYWRKVLRDETTSAHPRVILAAVTDGHMVGFTGPVDKEPSGRGWFTGICVDPLYGRRGIATVIFNDLMREFIREGALFSTLFTGEDHHARRLYAATGFEVRRRFSILRKTL